MATAAVVALVLGRLACRNEKGGWTESGELPEGERDVDVYRNAKHVSADAQTHVAPVRAVAHRRTENSLAYLNAQDARRTTQDTHY